MQASKGTAVMQQRSAVCNSRAAVQLARPSLRAVQSSSRRGVLARAGKVQKITAEQLEKALADRSTPIVVDFFATWCGPCLMLAKELEKVAEQKGDKVRIVKIDVDEQANQQLSSQLKINALPTIMFVPKDSSKPIQRCEGLMPADQIIATLEALDEGL